MDMEPAFFFEGGQLVFGEAGDYHADFVPSQPGKYTFHFTGTIDGERGRRGDDLRPRAPSRPSRTLAADVVPGGRRAVERGARHAHRRGERRSSGRRGRRSRGRRRIGRGCRVERAHGRHGRHRARRDRHHRRDRRAGDGASEAAGGPEATAMLAHRGCGRRVALGRAAVRRALGRVGGVVPPQGEGVPPPARLGRPGAARRPRRRSSSSAAVVPRAMFPPRTPADRRSRRGRAGASAVVDRDPVVRDPGRRPGRGGRRGRGRARSAGRTHRRGHEHASSRPTPGHVHLVLDGAARLDDLRARAGRRPAGTSPGSIPCRPSTWPPITPRSTRGSRRPCGSRRRLHERPSGSAFGAPSHRAQCARSASAMLFALATAASAHAAFESSDPADGRCSRPPRPRSRCRSPNRPTPTCRR